MILLERRRASRGERGTPVRLTKHRRVRGSNIDFLHTSSIPDGDWQKSVAEKIDYIALDSSNKNRKESEHVIATVFGSCDRRWYQNTAQLLSDYNKKEFDLVVLCNVLHEIPPEEWSKLFGTSGQLTELLNEEGYLLFVEDQRIPVGECAHQYGFIVIDTCSLKELFSIEGKDSKLVVDAQRDGRLKAHLVPKEYLARCSTDRVQASLLEHKKQAENEISSMRKDADLKRGRLFAFWVHQYTNASMALEKWPKMRAAAKSLPMLT
jgi:hypothetical protein